MSGSGCQGFGFICISLMLTIIMIYLSDYSLNTPSRSTGPSVNPTTQYIYNVITINYVFEYVNESSQKFRDSKLNALYTMNTWILSQLSLRRRQLFRIGISMFKINDGKYIYYI